MKTCTIIGGIDGVGKSSLLGVLRAVRTDLGLVVDEKEKAASERIETALKDGISFSYETTLHGEFSKELCRRAKDAGYAVRLYYVGLDPVDENLLRIKNRAKNGGLNAVPQIIRNTIQQRRGATKAAPLAISGGCGGISQFQSRRALGVCRGQRFSYRPPFPRHP